MRVEWLALPRLKESVFSMRDHVQEGLPHPLAADLPNCSAHPESHAHGWASRKRLDSARHRP